MNTNERTPEWVVENYLPDFWEKWRSFVKFHDSIGIAGDKDKWVVEHFPEALAVFEECIRRDQHERSCKAQRELCADEATPDYETTKEEKDGNNKATQEQEKEVLEM